jgi:glycosyltransferase involved in cell wall biosynthesis
VKIGLQATNIFFEGPKHAGVSRTSLRLLEAILENRQHQYVIFVRHDSPIPEHWLSLDHVHVVRAWAKTRSWHFLGRDIEPIKHRLNAWFSVSGYVPRTPGLVKGSLIHDIFWRKYAETYTEEDRMIHEKMAQNIANHSTFIASNSQSTAKDFGEAYKVDPSKFIVLPFGIGQDITSNVPKQLDRPQSLPDDSDYIFTISTLEPRKNLPRLFEAFAKINKERPDLNLVIAGAKGWKTDGIAERVAELGLENKIHFLGFVPDAEVPALFQHAKVAITASLEEGFGVPVLEAMTYGSVVAASSSPALREIGEDIPFYFEPTNVASIAQGLREALDTPHRDEKIKLAQERSRHFSWVKSAELLLDRIQKDAKK